jgi:AraC family transcriptional regulator
MLLRIETLTEKKLVGNHLSMSFAANKTGELWRGFMPHRKEILNPVGTDLYSVEVYPALFFNPFDASAEFEKWAAVEVTDFDRLPDGMQPLTLPPGLYAVFLHQGPASSGSKTYGYIFETWLPQSDFSLDHRPHFALMGEKYKSEDPASEEEIWIPIRPK